MDMNDVLETCKENATRFQNFIVFDPNSVRVLDSDIYLIGDDVRKQFDLLYSRLNASQSIGHQILDNRLGKIGQMLELVSNYDQVIITKYFDRVWKRYAYISNLGESFLNFPTFAEYFPEEAANVGKVIADRVDEGAILFDTDDSETDSTDTKPGDTDTKPGDTDAKPGDTDTKPNNAEDTTDNPEKTLENA